MALDLVSVNLMALDGVSSAVKVTEPSLKVSTYEFAALTSEQIMVLHFEPTSPDLAKSIVTV